MRIGCLLFAVCAGSVALADRPTLVVTVAPPLDGQQLGDALRIYLEGVDVDVRTAEPEPDLRAQIDATLRAGEAARAVAALRIVTAESTSVEIQLVDRLTQKTLIARLPRSRRDEDFYRTLALKVQALLRATLSEEPEKVAAVAPALTPLVTAMPRPRERRLFFDAAYTAFTYPTGAVVHHGVAIDARVDLGRRFELTLGIAGLAPVGAQKSDVTVLLYSVPIHIAVGLHLRRPRIEASLSGVVELLVLRLDSSSAASTVRSDTAVAAGFGGQLSGRVRLNAMLALYLRATVLGLVGTPRFTVRGETVLDPGDLQVSVECGLALSVY